MDIFVLGPEASGRKEEFRRFAEAQACRVHLSAPAASALDPGAHPKGVVLFDDGGPEAAALLAEVRERVRFRGLPVVVVPSPGPDTTDAQILADIRTQFDLGPVFPRVREQILEPFITAAGLSLREWAGTEVDVRAVYQKKGARTFGDLSALLRFESGLVGTLAVCFPAQTAAALAGRVFAGTAVAVDQDLVLDCVGEIGNLIAGHAKALLAGLPFRFAFATPTVVSGTGQEIQAERTLDSLVGVLGSDLGEFALQVCLAGLDNLLGQGNRDSLLGDCDSRTMP